MQDDDWIESAGSTIVAFCDAKKGAQDFNEAWSNAEDEIMESFLALVGIVPKECWIPTASDLYRQGWSQPDKHLRVTTLLLHHDPDAQVARRWPRAPRIQLSAALRFVHQRFKAYQDVKTPHGQWEPTGQALWEQYSRHRSSVDEFIQHVLGEIGSV